MFGLGTKTDLLCLEKGCYVRENTLGLKNDIITQSGAVTKLIDVPGMNKLEYKYRAIFALLTDIRLRQMAFIGVTCSHSSLVSHEFCTD